MIIYYGIKEHQSLCICFRDRERRSGWLYGRREKL